MLRSFLMAAALLARAGLAHAAPDSTAAAKPQPRLVVLSRPAGISFRLEGPRTLVGRTPMTLQNALAGRYQLESLEPGFHRWRQTLDLRGSSPDSVWMTMRMQSAAGAGARSLILPGWGQVYDGHPAASVFWLITSAAGAAGALRMQSIYLERRDDLDAAERAAAKKTNPTTLAAVERARDRWDQARLWRGIVTTTAGGIWGLNVLEAMIRFPRFRAGHAELELAPATMRLGSRLPHAADHVLARVTTRF